MEATTEVNPGEIYIKLGAPVSGKVSLADLGVSNENLDLKSGLLRLVIDLDSFREFKFYQVPTLEFHYEQDTTETHWQCDYNGHTMLDKLDHHGRSTVLLLKRNELSTFENRHENKLIVHAEFEEPINLIADRSFIHLFN